MTSVLKTALPAFFAIATLLPAVAGAIGGFSPSLFQFVVTVRAGSNNQPGGWQEASTRLNFVDTRSLIPQAWSCSLKVGMPLQTAIYGRISPESAAGMAASMATKASGEVMHRQEKWLTADFCVQFIARMNELFTREHRPLGARVNGP